jgi:hypothetical protein
MMHNKNWYFTVGTVLLLAASILVRRKGMKLCIARWNKARDARLVSLSDTKLRINPGQAKFAGSNCGYEHAIT